jgi:RPA family protein
MNQKFNRLTAFPTLISDIYKYEFKKGEGEWDPSYLDFGHRKVSRVVLVGTIVDNRVAEANTVTVDDGSGTIDVREFADENKVRRLLEKQQIGDIILIIGRIREYNSQRYILPEIVKNTEAAWARYNLMKAKIENKRHNKDEVIIRTPEVLAPKKDVPKINTEELEVKEEPIDDKPIDQIINKADIVLKIISEEDKGDGVDIIEVVDKSMLDNCEQIVNDLLASGDLFMVKPGRVKVL